MNYKIILIIILITGAAIRLFNLEYPNKPVFDEVHFASYANDFANQRPYFDIHPPLGKVIYALPLLGQNEKFSQYQFLKTVQGDEPGKIKNIKPVKSYGDFPYYNLRLISVFFGVLLTLSVFLFVKVLTKENVPALLAALFITFENSIITETRFIFMNGIYLSLGFLALYFLFKEKTKPFIAGVFWGLSLSVKFIAIVFLGPVLIWFLLKKNDERRKNLKGLISFLIIGFLILFFTFYVLNIVLIPQEKSVKFYQDIFASKINLNNEFVLYLFEFTLSLSGYTGGVTSHPWQSNWYTWPLMLKPMPYYIQNFPPKLIGLIGNPVIYYLSFAFFILILIKFKKYFLKNDKREVFLILLSGYIFSILPFLFIKRPAFLYHYFPALIFLICLISLIINEHLKTLKTDQKKFLISALIFSIILGFAIVAPYTYGL